MREIGEEKNLIHTFFSFNKLHAIFFTIGLTFETVIFMRVLLKL